MAHQDLTGAILWILPKDPSVVSEAGIHRSYNKAINHPCVVVKDRRDTFRNGNGKLTICSITSHGGSPRLPEWVPRKNMFVPISPNTANPASYPRQVVLSGEKTLDKLSWIRLHDSWEVPLSFLANYKRHLPASTMGQWRLSAKSIEGLQHALDRHVAPVLGNHTGLATTTHSVMLGPGQYSLPVQHDVRIDVTSRREETEEEQEEQENSPTVTDWCSDVFKHVGAKISSFWSRFV